MKKFIEITEIRVDRSVFYNSESYPEKGCFYIATDELGVREFIYNTKKEGYGIMSLPENDVDKFEAIEMPEAELTQLVQSGVSEATLLKAIAITKDSNLAEKLIPV
jgi:hypothetical protein